MAECTPVVYNQDHIVMSCPVCQRAWRVPKSYENTFRTGCTAICDCKSKLMVEDGKVYEFEARMREKIAALTAPEASSGPETADPFPDCT